MSISASAEHLCWLTREKTFEPTERPDDAVRIAQAIWERMDPEWRELVDEENQEQHRLASLALAHT